MTTTHNTADNTESLWNMVFGTNTTAADVLADAVGEDLTPQDYVADCIHTAMSQGLEGDRYEHFATLCKELNIAVS